MSVAPERLRAYAELAVGVGVNLRPGQDLLVLAYVEHAPLVRAIAGAAYRAGARYVAVQYSDPHVKRALIEHGPEESLAWTPPWLVEQLEEVGRREGALIQVAGDAEPELFAGLDGGRVGRALMKELAEASLRLLTGRGMSWSIVAWPSEGWARTVFGEPDVDRLWEAIASTVRLDEDDPVASWSEHVERLAARAAELTERGFDALRFRGPGTDLTVGLLPGGVWKSARDETRWGQRHIPNRGLSG